MYNFRTKNIVLSSIFKNVKFKYFVCWLYLFKHVPIFDHSVLEVRADLHSLLWEMQRSRIDVVLLFRDVVAGHLGNVNLKKTHIEIQL